MWLARGTGPANAGARTEVNAVGMRLAGLGTGDHFEFAFRALDNQPELLSVRSSFGERFSFDQSDTPKSAKASAQVLATFDDRFSFSGEGPASIFLGELFRSIEGHAQRSRMGLKQHIGHNDFFG